MIEDYKPLDVECAAMGLRLCRGIRARYPEWRHLADGDGGDENLKDYPIEENPELTIRSVVDNLMLYQEGWGVGRIKHSLTYSGGLSRSYVRTYAPARAIRVRGLQPLHAPDVIEVAEGIPFASLTDYDVPTLYALKGEIVRRGVKAVTGFDMPVYPEAPVPARRDAGRDDARAPRAIPNGRIGRHSNACIRERRDVPRPAHRNVTVSSSRGVVPEPPSIPRVTRVSSSRTSARRTGMSRVSRRCF